MRVHIGADYRAYNTARELESWLASLGHQVEWAGAEEYDEGDDYPLFALRVGLAVIDDEDNGAHTAGLVIGTTGQGEIMSANKVQGARAVFGLNQELVADGRRHINANVLVVPSALLTPEEMKAVILTFFETAYSRDVDDTRRLINTAEYEASKTIEGWKINKWRDVL